MRGGSIATGLLSSDSQREVYLTASIKLLARNQRIGGTVKCSVCGGQLIWDYDKGEIVCTACGVVVGILTTFEVCEYRKPSSSLEVGEARQRDRNERVKNKKLRLREYRQMLKLYRECVKMVKSKPWLEVDYNKVFKTGKFIMSIRSKASINAIKNIEVLGYWDVLRKGLEFIYHANPAFLARSERSKYALAYIVARKLETGNYPACEEVTAVFNISNTSYKRLCALADKLLLATYPRTHGT